MVSQESKNMQMKTKHPNWGGRRPNAGRPPSGILKSKVSVSVSIKAWEKAMEMWDGKASHLVDKLIKEYVEREAKKA